MQYFFPEWPVIWFKIVDTTYTYVCLCVCVFLYLNLYIFLSYLLFSFLLSCFFFFFTFCLPFCGFLFFSLNFSVVCQFVLIDHFNLIICFFFLNLFFSYNHNYYLFIWPIFFPFLYPYSTPVSVIILCLWDAGSEETPPRKMRLRILKR